MAMVLCKECGKERSSSADACPHCGAKVKKTSAFTWLVVVILVLMFIGYIAGTGDTPSGPPAVNEYRDQSGEAARVCQDFVKDRLKAPATADFPWKFDSFQDTDNRDQYTISSYVDSQN